MFMRWSLVSGLIRHERKHSKRKSTVKDSQRPAPFAQAAFEY
jgi:hypothetical protein